MTPSTDPLAPFARFVDAQAPVFDAVRRELAAGRKRSHWMWFVFPQLAALGRSATARHYGLADLDQAAAYATHPLLGPRLRESVGLVLALPPIVRDPQAIFGSPDDLKFRSCLTLFERAAPAEPCFGRALDRFYGGERDPLTASLLGDSPMR